MTVGRAARSTRGSSHPGRDGRIRPCEAESQAVRLADSRAHDARSTTTELLPPRTAQNGLSGWTRQRRLRRDLARRDRAAAQLAELRQIRTFIAPRTPWSAAAGCKTAGSPTARSAMSCGRAPVERVPRSGTVVGDSKCTAPNGIMPATPARASTLCCTSTSSPQCAAGRSGQKSKPRRRRARRVRTARSRPPRRSCRRASARPAAGGGEPGVPGSRRYAGPALPRRQPGLDQLGLRTAHRSNGSSSASRWSCR